MPKMTVRVYYFFVQTPVHEHGLLVDDGRSASQLGRHLRDFLVEENLFPLRNWISGPDGSAIVTASQMFCAMGQSLPMTDMNHGFGGLKKGRHRVNDETLQKMRAEAAGHSFHEYIMKNPEHTRLISKRGDETLEALGHSTMVALNEGPLPDRAAILVTGGIARWDALFRKLRRKYRIQEPEFIMPPGTVAMLEMTSTSTNGRPFKSVYAPPQFLGDLSRRRGR